MERKFRNFSNHQHQFHIITQSRRYSSSVFKNTAWECLKLKLLKIFSLCSRTVLVNRFKRSSAHSPQESLQECKLLTHLTLTTHNVSQSTRCTSFLLMGADIIRNGKQETDMIVCLGRESGGKVCLECLNITQSFN